MAVFTSFNILANNFLPLNVALGSMSTYSSIYLHIQLWRKPIIIILTLLVLILFAIANFPVSSGLYSGKIIAQPELSGTSFISAAPAGKGGGLSDGKNYNCSVILENKRVVKANCYEYNYVNQIVNVSITESMLPFFSAYRVIEPNKQINQDK